jgi:hypothetical protein
MTRISIRPAIFVLVALLATTLPAQTPATTSCPAPLVEVPNMYSMDTLVLAIDPGYGIKPVDSTLALTALSVVNDALVLPKPLALPAVITKWYGSVSGGMDQAGMGTQGFMGEAFVDIQHNGKVKRVGLTQTTLVPELDAALVAAVKKAADDGAFMAYQDGAHDHGGYVFVELRTVPLPEFHERAVDYKRPEPDAPIPTPYSNEPKIKNRGTVVTLPIRALRIPLVRLSSPLAVTKRGPAPVFPLRELGARQDGFVNVEFVVGTDGAVVPGTLRLANAMTAEYAKAVINSLDRYRFKPATAGSCPIAARETYTFTFDVL